MIFHQQLRCRFLAEFVLIVCLFFLGAFACAQTLPRYTCLTKQFHTQKWMLQYSRLLDLDGVIMQKMEHHPLSIAFFGIMNYEDYLRTGDTIAYWHVRNQFKYFADTSHMDYTEDGLGAGLPYLKDHRDLKAPWYSGMTQGVAISFLLRYYALTQDARALTLAKQLAHFMLQPVDSGGTIGKTLEGEPWIEEYPGSLRSPQVLNGFINGLIGLYEYCEFFPEDTLARKIHDACYASLRVSLPLYDSAIWTNYDRRGQPCTYQYIRYEIAQLEHLLEIYGERQFWRQMMIWSLFAYNRLDTEISFYHNPRYQFGDRLKQHGDGSLFTEWDFYKVLKPAKEYIIVDPKRKQDTLGLPLILRRKQRIRLDFPKPLHFIRLELDGPAPVQVLVPAPMGLQSPKEDKKGRGEMIWIPLEAQGKSQVAVNGNSMDIVSAVPIQRLILQSQSKADVLLHEVLVQNEDSQALPMFLFDTLSAHFNLEQGKSYRILYEVENIADLHLFYRHAAESIGVPWAPWREHNVITDISKPFIAPETGEYAFFLCFPFLLPHPRFAGLDVVPEE
jgi:heparosan-N-sulfate-glucuronate 5-epimerase